MAFNSPLHDFPIFSPSFFAGKKYSSLGMGNPLLVRGGVLFPISLPPKDPFFNPTFILLIAGKSDDASFSPRLTPEEEEASKYLPFPSILF